MDINGADLKNLCINTARKLVCTPDELSPIDPGLNMQSRLIFPKYGSKNTVRQSEQESRFMFAHSIEQYHKQIYFSIETPTEQKFKFSEPNIIIGDGQSAMFDLTLYQLDENSKFQPAINVEFKAHNVEKSHIEKDLVKLISDPPDGLFFHFLSAVDTGTLPDAEKWDGEKGIFGKYFSSLKDRNKEWNKPKKASSKSILFAVCILEQNVLLLKVLKSENLQDLKDFFKINYSILHMKINLPENNRNGWEVVELSDKTINE